MWGIVGIRKMNKFEKRTKLAMRIKSIEPTPNPNSMKVNLDSSLERGIKFTYVPENKANCPKLFQHLLEIEGVKSIFHVSDFFTIQRKPNTDWERILSQARMVLEGKSPDTVSPTVMPPIPSQPQNWGEVTVHQQFFRNLPMLVKVSSGKEVLRVALPPRFTAAVEKARPSSKNMLMERKWIEQESRYGTLKNVGETVAQEIDAAYDENILAELIEKAFQQNAAEVPVAYPKRMQAESLKVQIASENWTERFAALKKMGYTEEALPYLLKFLNDPNASIRRLAAVYLGLLKMAEVVQPLCNALKDKNVSVRRTVGDALNDLGDPSALPAMIETLKDSNKLVRWRAARFLYESGDELALPSLYAAKEDPEFEVQMQINQAIERIEGGHKAQGPIWQQMTKTR